MKIFILISILYFTHFTQQTLADIFGDRVYKYHLRGMHKEELERVIKNSIQNTVERLYHKILESARKGKINCPFTFMCEEERTNTNCKIQNGHENWLEKNPNNILASTNYYITIEQYTKNVTNLLNEIFPDSNITKIYKNCCEYYTIYW